MRKFLIQQIINDQVCQGIYSEMQLIRYLDMSDCYDGEYKIYDVTDFGQVKEVFYNGWLPGRLIKITDIDGNVVVSGYGTDH
jgi:hypothetical protein